MPTGDRRAMCSTTCLAPAERIDQPQTSQADGVVGRDADLVGDRGNLSPRLVVQPFPVGAHGDRAERWRARSLLAIHELARDRAKSRIVAEPDHVLSANSRWNEAIAFSAAGRPIRSAALSKRTPVARTAELACEVACAVKPRCAALWLGGQLCGSLEGGDRDVSGPAIHCPLGCGVELFSDYLVRPGCCRGAVPDGAGPADRPAASGESSVCAPKLVGRRRLLDRRDDQRVSESKYPRVERPEAGGDSRLQVGGVHRLSRRPAQLGQVDFVERRAGEAVSARLRRAS
jgi:hypothetical protein